ncbi:MFS transporter [bacterium]|nr:MFS transporter [bacterium]
MLIACAWPFRFRNEYSEGEDEPELGLINGLRQAFVAVRRPDVLRWMVLLECSNLMLDILLAFLALYFVNVVGVSPEQAALGVAVWTGVGLVGDFLIIPLLERVHGLTYLRFSAATVLVLYALFLLVQPFALKLMILGALGFFNAGWYSILQGQLYSAMPGRGGTIMAAGNFFGLIAGFVPLLLGIIAQGFGLPVTMWLLLIGPIGLLVGLPRKPGGGSGV